MYLVNSRSKNGNVVVGCGGGMWWWDVVVGCGGVVQCFYKKQNTYQKQTANHQTLYYRETPCKMIPANKKQQQNEHKK